MADMDKKLRRTLFGGFNCRDVVSYIDRLTASHRSESAELRRELEKTSAELSEARKVGGDAESVRGELEAASNSLSEKTEELEVLTAAHEATVSELAEARAKLDKYERADVELEQKLAELEAVKARVIDIELAAHERARRIEEDALGAAAAARAEANRLVCEVRERYKGARLEAEKALGIGVAELDRLREIMCGLMIGFDEIGSGLDRVSADGEDR